VVKYEKGDREDIEMKYATLCSGVEAPSVAWEPLGWEPLWFSEYDPKNEFPAQVLAHHYPNVPNLGDITKIQTREEFRESNPDLIIAGTPCQAFSIAGLRKGTDDPRGKLTFEFVRILEAKRPQWFIWENVPGVLSINDGRTFYELIQAFTQIGYGVSWRVLDAQYFGVPQRRRRVFVVGYLGDWRPSQKVLFESESLPWHLAKSREKRKRAPLDTERGVGKTGGGLNSIR